MKGGCDPETPECRRWWVSTRTYTAKCLDGREGESVTVTRQARSFISQEDADREAARLAECEAKAEIQCYFEASASVLTGCTAVDPAQMVTKTGQSKLSPEDAYAKALAAAQESAENLCEFGFEGGHIPLVSMEGVPIFSLAGQQIVTAA